MAKVMNEAGIKTAPYTSKDKNCKQILCDFKEKRIRFLCTCSMISEGWDYPSLRIIVMARPTLSKVLYLQEIGRGLRKTPVKKNVFVIDVVDEYGAMVKPCSMHSIFGNPFYVPFGLISKRDYKEGDFVTVDGITERIEKITKVDVEDFSNKYKDFLSTEQLARDFFVGTETVNSWIKKQKITADVTFQFGSKKIALFSPENAQKIKKQLNIKEHNDETIKNDFFDFLSERDYSLSYKMPFLLSFLLNTNKIGEAKIDDVLSDYILFYENRIAKKMTVDKKSCPYNLENLSNKKYIKENMLSNPFEKFERKRFMYFSKDLSMLSFNSSLWEKLTESDIIKIKTQMVDDLKNYYKNLGGIDESDKLVLFATADTTVEYQIRESKPLKVADSGSLYRLNVDFFN